MAHIDDVAAQFVKPPELAVASDRTRIVTDAFRLDVAPEEEYVESDVVIESLAFASHVVGGLAAAAVAPTSGVRASTEVILPLSDSSGATAESRRRIVLFGPGDVRGIDPQQILRRHPAPGTPNAEETTLPHIEFDRPELPWAFSAAAPEDPLRPWVALVVVPAARARRLPPTALLPLVELPFDELPALTTAHLWAHAQTARQAGVSLPTRLSPEFAPVNLSRLLSPRVLEPETEYLALVVPTTDVGSRGGRGATGGTLAEAWTSASGDTVVLPYYDSWQFRTGEAGDFQTLALRLRGVVAPYAVGRRFIDVSEPGRPLTSLGDGEPGTTQVLRCALYSPSPPPPEHEIAETAAWPPSKTRELREQLDRPAVLEGSAKGQGGIPDVPIVGPRIYGRAHRGEAVVTGGDWFAELNLSPLHRIVAGLGTRVVQRDQEQLMQAAWAQLGEVEKANRAIALAQLGELLAERLHARLAALEPSRLLQVAAPLAARVSLSTGATLAAQVAASATPATVLSGAFRRTVRPDGPVLRRADDLVREGAGTLVGTGTTTRDFTRVYENPDGVVRLSSASIAELDAERIAPVLDVPVREVPDVLRRAEGAVDISVFGRLADPSSWRAVDPGFDLGAVVVERWAEVVLREPSVSAAATVREQRIAPLVAELATAKAASGLDIAGRLEERAKTLNNSVLSRFGGGATISRPGAGGGILRGGSIVRGSAIGGAVARIPLDAASAVRVTAELRRPTGVRGVTMIDARSLSRVTTSTSREAKTTAFRQLARLATVPVTPVLDAVGTLSLDRLRHEIPILLDAAGVRAIQPVPRRETVRVDALATALEPRTTVRSALRGRLTLTPELAGRVFLPHRIRRIMAAPVFPRPMYEALSAYDTDWLLPGLTMLPDTDFVTVLATNRQFMEAFLVGLSDEMGRELLWRNYPTDQSGTYFRRFWDRHEDELAQQIHAFAKTDLGSHVAIGGSGGSSGSSQPRAVVVVKSDLVRRYPDVIVQVVKNHGTPEEPQFDGPGAEIAKELFAAHLEPDVAIVGVDLGIDELDGDDSWWITIAEHPTATRFDRPAGAAGPFHSPVQANAADVAVDVLHEPVRVAFHATDLILRED